jgi:predicted SpoU family rRNA methylase
MLRSLSGKEKGKTVTIYRMPFRDVVKRMRAAFGSHALKQKGKQQKVRRTGRSALSIKRVYVTMQPTIPMPGKTSWSRKCQRGRSVHLTAYGYGVNELRKKIPARLGAIVI